jgi:hypothetical protein
MVLGRAIRQGFRQHTCLSAIFIDCNRGRALGVLVKGMSDALEPVASEKKHVRADSKILGADWRLVGSERWHWCRRHQGNGAATGAGWVRANESV